MCFWISTKVPWCCYSARRCVKVSAGYIFAVCTWTVKTIHTYTHTHTHTHSHTHMHTHAHAYTRSHAHTHTHTHRCRPREREMGGGEGRKVPWTALIVVVTLAASRCTCLYLLTAPWPLATVWLCPCSTHLQPRRWMRMCGRKYRWELDCGERERLALRWLSLL